MSLIHLQVQDLGNGLKFQEVESGSGSKLRNGMSVAIRYKGLFTDGTTFDQNHDGSLLKFKLGEGQVVKGLELGMKGMKVGGKRNILIPPHLGYGKRGTSGIPGNAQLVFEIDLIEITSGKKK